MLNMVDIIGNIKVDESKPERVKYLLACIRSYEFLKDHARFLFYLEGASEDLTKAVEAEFFRLNYNYNIFPSYAENGGYGVQYWAMMQFSRNPYVLNFMEDQFMVLDCPFTFEMMLTYMKYNKVDLLKASFFDVEQKSSSTITERNEDDVYRRFKSAFGKVFVMNESNFIQYNQHYGSRYFIGVNFLTTKDFAIKFWGRELGTRPHAYEVPNFDRAFIHTAMIPAFELQAAIDDDHGETDTCLLSRNEPKFSRLYER
jgi:hypothetical protein